ncbi:MAG: hypothetical protein Q9186_004217 [Xanthomendoza sp. 1 TL-2023]
MRPRSPLSLLLRGFKGGWIMPARSPIARRTFSSSNSTSAGPGDILPNHPTWSLQDLLETQHTESDPQVSEKELHHLLRLSALPLPKDGSDQQRMQKDLESQLKFVKAIQDVEIPDSVKPLQSIREETEEGMKEVEITVESLADDFAKEEVVGIRGRIRRKDDAEATQVEEEKWHPLKLAPRTVGRYVAVNTAKD